MSKRARLGPDEVSDADLAAAAAAYDDMCPASPALFPSPAASGRKRKSALEVVDDDSDDDDLSESEALALMAAVDAAEADELPAAQPSVARRLWDSFASLSPARSATPETDNAPTPTQPLASPDRDDHPVHGPKHSPLRHGAAAAEQLFIPDSDKEATAEDSVKLNLEQMAAVDAILDASGPVVVCGCPGTGKTTLLRSAMESVERLQALPKGARRVQVAAPMAAAAYNLDPVGGVTLHKLLGIGINAAEWDATRSAFKLLAELQGLFNGQQLLIITEAFTMERRLFLFLDEVLRTAARKARLWNKAKQPLGGAWVVFDGDPLQMSPVSKKKGRAPYMFQAVHPETMRPVQKFDDLWLAAFPRSAVGKRVFILEENWRQKADPEFAAAVRHLAFGTIDKHPNLISLLLDCEGADPETATRIYPTNEKVDAYNRAKLAKLEGDATVFKVIHTDKLRANQLEKLPVLEVKPESRVRCTINHRIEGAHRCFNLSNGQMGWVSRITGNTVWVRFDHDPDNEVPVTYTEMHEFRRSREEEQRLLLRKIKPQPTPKCIPLALAWAMTVHRAQGLTLTEGVIADLSKTFDPAMNVVAVSRATSRDKLTLTNLCIEPPADGEETPSTMFYRYYKS